METITLSYVYDKKTKKDIVFDILYFLEQDCSFFSLIYSFYLSEPLYGSYYKNNDFIRKSIYLYNEELNVYISKKEDNNFIKMKATFVLPKDLTNFIILNNAIYDDTKLNNAPIKKYIYKEDMDFDSLDTYRIIYNLSWKKWRLLLKILKDNLREYLEKSRRYINYLINYKKITY